jgi:hypothetical protein
MWVALGGAASQLFELDTTVSTPLLVGEHVVSDSIAALTLGLTNLDADVVDLQLGPSTVGVLALSGFVNDGDGTGSVTATFDTAVAARELTVVAVDDVDNESAESPIHLVNSLEQSTLNDAFSIAPQETVSTPTCNRLIDAVPASGFILKRQYTVPYTFGETALELRSVTPNAPVEVLVARRGLPGDASETQRYVVVPSGETELISVRLGRGVNVVTAFDGYGRADTAIIAATTYAAILCGYAREIYNESTVLVDEQEAAIYSSVSTRLVEPLVSFSRLLPDVRSQQTLAMKLAVRALVSGAGRESGVTDLLTALTLSTPIFTPQAPDGEFFEPVVRPMYLTQEAFAGVEAHVWLANACIQRWLAFVRYISNAPGYQLLSLTENEVVFTDPNSTTQRHVFDLTAEECSLTQLALQSLCFDNIDIGVSITSDSPIAICAASYPLDMRPVPAYPVHEFPAEFTTGLALDPGFDGYVDFSLTDHWDGGATLDSLGAQPSPGSGFPTCVHEDGYLVVPLILASADVTANAAPTVSASATYGPARAATLDLLLSATGVEVVADLDINIRDTSLRTQSAETDMDLVIEGTETLTAGLSIAISAA